MDTMKNIVSVEFPGVVNNVDRMVEMLGGMESLEKAVNTSGTRLQLRFRPEDMYCHAVHGDCNPTNNLLVKFKRKRILYSDGSKEEKTEAEIVGIIGTTYTFTSLCDFQFLPMKKVEGSLKYVSIKEDVIPSKVYDSANTNDKEFNYSAPVFILPIIFSRFDQPANDYYFKDGPEAKDQGSTSRDKAVIAKVRKSRSIKACVVSFVNGDAIPLKPTNEVRIAFENLGNKEIFEKLKVLFQERPVWTRTHLLYRLRVKLSDLKYSLPMIAFLSVDGPWKNTWTRYGYDFRREREGRFLQTIDFRMRKTYNNKKIDEEILQDKKQKRGRDMQYQIPLQKEREKKNMTFLSLTSSSSSKSIEEEQMKKDQEMEKLFLQIFFRPETIPSNRQLVYQLMDIELDEVKEMLERQPDKNPDEKDGWLPKGSLDRIRELMKKTLDDTITRIATEKGWIEEKSDSFLKGLNEEEETSMVTDFIDFSIEDYDAEDDDEAFP